MSYVYNRVENSHSNTYHDYDHDDGDGSEDEKHSPLESGDDDERNDALLQ